MQTFCRRDCRRIDIMKFNIPPVKIGVKTKPGKRSKAIQWNGWNRQEVMMFCRPLIAKHGSNEQSRLGFESVRPDSKFFLLSEDGRVLETAEVGDWIVQDAEGNYSIRGSLFCRQKPTL